MSLRPERPCKSCGRLVFHKLRNGVSCNVIHGVCDLFSLFRVSWSQFKSYFLFKLEKVMEDFRASAPEQRGPANPNVESVPFEEMKERILKIVNGYNG